MVLLFLIWDFIFSWKSDIIVYAHCDILFIFLFFIESADTLIISINARGLRAIAREGEQLYKSVSDLVLYATGAAACSTSDLLMVLEAINRSLDNIERHLNRAYFETWRYIQVRIGYWKAKVYRSRTMREILDDAFGRWRGAGRLDY